MSRFIRRMLLCAVLLSGVSVVTPAVARADDQTAAAEQRQRAGQTNGNDSGPSRSGRRLSSSGRKNCGTKRRGLSYSGSRPNWNANTAAANGGATGAVSGRLTHLR